MKLGAALLGASVTVLALAAVGTLYALGGGGGAEPRYRATLALLREIQQLSSKWSIETARVKSDPLADFDSLAAFIPRMTRLKQNLAASVRQLPDLPDRLASDLRAHLSAIDAKEERIERFKTDYAVVRNSTSYFPLAGTNLVQQAEAAADDGLARTVAAISSDMSTYLLTPTDTGRSRLAASLQALRVASVEYPLPIANALVDFISHGEVLLDRKEPAEELFLEVTSNDLSDATNRLIGRLELELSRREVTATYYQRAILAVVGVLVSFWILLLLQQRSRGGPPRIDEAFEPSAEPAPTPEAAVDAAMRFEFSTEAPAEAGPRDSMPAIGSDAPAENEVVFTEAEPPARDEAPDTADGEEIVFVEDDPSFADAGEAAFVEREERPSGKDDPPARGRAPSAADAGGKAAFAEDDPSSAAADTGGEAVFAGREERPSGKDEPPPVDADAGGEVVSVGGDERPSGKDEPPDLSEASSAVAAAEDELLAIRELLLRIEETPPASTEEEPPPAASEGEPPPPDSVPPAAFPPAGEEEPPLAGEVVLAGEDALPVAAAGEARPVSEGEPPPPDSVPPAAFPPAGEEEPPLAGEVVLAGEDALPVAAAGEARPVSEGEPPPPDSAPPAVFPPAGEEEPPLAGEVVPAGEDALPVAAAGEAPPAWAEEEPPLADSVPPATFPPADEEELPFAGEVVPAGEDALPVAATGEAPPAWAEEEAPLADSVPPATFPPAGEEEPPLAGEVVPAGEDALPVAAAGEAPPAWAEEEAPLADSVPPAAFPPADEEELPFTGEAVPAVEDALPVAAAGEAPPAWVEEEPPLADSVPPAAFAPADEEELPFAGEAVPAVEDALPVAAAGEAPPAWAEEEPPLADSVPPAAFAPADEEELPFAGEAVPAGEDVLPVAAAGEAPPAWVEEEPPLPVSKRRADLERRTGPAGRATSRPGSLQETRDRIREALGAGAAIVDLRVRPGPDEEAGAASPAASNVRRDVHRIAELLERLAFSPHLPDRGAGRVDVNACIDEAIRTTGAEAAAAVERGLRPVPGISGSRIGVRLLLAEIVENSVLAVQAQHERPPVLRIHTSRRNDEVLVTIIDNGVGIPADAREAVFDPFHTSRDGSIGVGLTLARCLAERHEGTVRLNSSLHQGTVARITLPIERPVS